MSQTKAQLVSNIIGDVTGGAKFTGIVTATTFSGNITGTAATFTGNVSVAGGLIVTSGVSTFSDTTDFKGATETVSVGSTYLISSGRIVLECDAQNGTVFTHTLSTGDNVGIVSLRDFPVTKNSVTTFTIIFAQNSARKGKQLSPEHVEKISKAIKLRALPHKLTFMDGRTLITNNITDWAKENGYRGANLYQVKIGDKGRHKDIIKVELVE